MLVILLLCALVGTQPLEAQAAHVSQVLWPVPAGVVPPRAPSMASGAKWHASRWTRSPAPTDSMAGRRKAFHIGVIAGAALGGSWAAIATSNSGDAETVDPEPRTVAAAGFAGAVVGGVLGGVTGIIIHALWETATGR